MGEDGKEKADFMKMLDEVYKNGGNPEWTMDADGNVTDHLGLGRTPEEVFGFDPRAPRKER